MASTTLKKGDCIGIAAVSSPFDRALFLTGVDVLTSLGFRVSYRDDIFDRDRYFAGTEERRASEFMELMQRDDIAAVLFARGGYGSQRVIPLLDAQTLGNHRKPVVGFSDATALLTFLRQNAAVPTFYGPVVTQLARDASGTSAEHLVTALSTSGPLGSIPVGEARVFKPGKAEGSLVGGCLSLITSSIGTSYALMAKDAILFLEDTGEKVYVLDRMLTQLKASGMLDGVRGIIFGSLKPVEGEPHDLEEMLLDVLQDFEGPIISSFPAGHVEPFVTLPMKARVLLEADAQGARPSLISKEGLLS